MHPIAVPTRLRPLASASAARRRRRIATVAAAGLALAFVIGPTAPAPQAAAATAALLSPALPAVDAAFAPANTAVMPASATAVTLGLGLVASGISRPVAIASPRDGTRRIFVVGQEGRIWIVRNGTKLATPFLDIRAKVSCCGERGLLGIAFHPAYATNRRFFVFYTDANGSLVVSRFVASSTNANRAATGERVILRIAHAQYANHNGGQLAFGPDGYLYIGTGDGGGAGDPLRSGQSRRTLLGKILRIDVNHVTATHNYTIPPTNPYATSTTSRREIWSFGLRNPWRFSFDRRTGDLWIGDVGQDRYEEVDRALRSGGGGRAVNFGWSVMEGFACYRPATGCSTTGKRLPLAVYGHGATGNCAVVGGFAYRGSRYPALAGLYLFGDYCSGRIWRVAAGGASRQSPVLLRDTSLMISAFGEDQAGELYVADYASGRIYHITGA